MLPWDQSILFNVFMIFSEPAILIWKCKWYIIKTSEFFFIWKQPKYSSIEFANECKIFLTWVCKWIYAKQNSVNALKQCAYSNALNIDINEI
jgi:hypothetical protein